MFVQIKSGVQSKDRWQRRLYPNQKAKLVLDFLQGKAILLEIYHRKDAISPKCATL
jgi:hypothetical protein